MTAETTICTCVEAGALEQHAILLAESLRRFGGRYADLPFVAVKPRMGPPIAAATRRAFSRLGVEFVDERLNDALSWWDHANKPATIRYVEAKASTPCVTWLDSDIVVLDEPTGFAPLPGTDFIARAGEAHDVASTGSDEKAEYWRRLAEIFDLDFEAFPTITSWPDRVPIRAYWQTGAFSCATEKAFGKTNYAVLSRMFESGVISKFAGMYHQDQVSAALTVQVLKLKCSQYDPRMNFNYNFLDKAGASIIPVNEVKLLHYHGSFSPRAYAWARSGLESLPADRLALIDRFAPLETGGFALKALRRLYSIPRQRRIADFRAQAVAY